MLRDDITIGDKYQPAMQITEQTEADAYFELCVAHTIRVRGLAREEAEQIERQNLAYFAGYFTAEIRERVERLFQCAHPVFGAIAAHGQPTAGQAFDAGKAIAEGSQR